MSPDNKLRVYILDDELPAITKLRHQLAQISEIELVGYSQKPKPAMDEILKLEPDIVFLDINLSELDGFDLLPSIPDTSSIIFTTAYSEYAVKAFDKSVADYLLKPFDTERLLQAIGQVKQRRLSILQEQSLPDDEASQHQHVVSKTGDRIFIIKIEDVYFFKSRTGGIYAYTQSKAYPISDSLERLEQRLNQRGFVRFHRSFLININHIKEIQRWFGGKLLVIMKDNQQTEINSSREGAKKIKQLFNL